MTWWLHRLFQRFIDWDDRRSGLKTRNEMFRELADATHRLDRIQVLLESHFEDRDKPERVAEVIHISRARGAARNG